MNIVVLCGGVGAARFLLGLQSLKVLHPEINISAIVNTGDDDIFYGQYVCPDIDTILYHLSQLHDEQRGWGRKNDTFHFVETLRQLGQDAWFNLGDKDLALNQVRTDLLSRGSTLDEVTTTLSKKLKIDNVNIIPMSNERVTTVITTDDNQKLKMQEYFVREQSQPNIAHVSYEGEHLTANKTAIKSIKNADRIIIAPSNPFLSIFPILSINEITDLLKTKRHITTAISPLIGNSAIKGPLAYNMKTLGYEINSIGIARLYKDFICNIVIDESDSELEDKINALGIKTRICPTLMDSENRRLNLASFVTDIEVLR